MRGLALIAALVAVAVGCKRDAPEEEAAPLDPAAAREACRSALDTPGFGGGYGVLIAACAPMIGDPVCRGAVEAAGEANEASEGLAAMKRCAERYCPKHPDAELCELASPGARQLRATFPRLLTETLKAEHGEALGTLDAAAYLITAALLPAERKLYIRIFAPAPGADEVEVAAGDRGWSGCHLAERWTVPLETEAASAALRPRLRALLGDAEPALVEAMIDAGDDPRLQPLATRIGQDLRRGVKVVVCRNQRKNCPDVISCP